MTIATATDISSIRINGERLWASLMELAKIGATPKGGVCRLTLTDLDKQGRALVEAALDGWTASLTWSPTRVLLSPEARTSACRSGSGSVRCSSGRSP